MARSTPFRGANLQASLHPEERPGGSRLEGWPTGQTLRIGFFDDPAQYFVADPYSLVIYGWGRKNGLPIEQLRNYTAFKDRMLQHPAVHKVLGREESALLQR